MTPVVAMQPSSSTERPSLQRQSSVSEFRNAGKQVQTKASRLRATNALFARRWLSDPYFTLLELEWSRVLLVILMSYILVILLCLLPLLPVADDLVGEPRAVESSFARALFFSANNVLTMGFGQLHGSTSYTYLCGSLQHFIGMIVNVLVFSLVLSKFQKPKCDIIFSDKALVVLRDQIPYLLFRVGNLRCNSIYQPDLRVALLRRHQTCEGECFMRTQSLDVIAPPMLRGCNTLVHKIDQSSPLQELANRDLFAELEPGELVVSVAIVGFDGIYGDCISAMKRYDVSDSVFGRQFADVMSRSKAGHPRVNFARFHELVYPDYEDDSPVCSPKGEGEAAVAEVERAQPAKKVSELQLCYSSEGTGTHAGRPGKSQMAALREALQLKSELEEADELDDDTRNRLSLRLRSLKANAIDHLEGADGCGIAYDSQDDSAVVAVREPTCQAPWDAFVEEPIIDDDGVAVLVHGASRLHEGQPLEPSCGFCVFTVMVFRKLGVPLRIVLVELDVDRPEWFKRRTGVDHPEVPVVFYRGEVLGVKSTQDLIDRLPHLFPCEAEQLRMFQPSPHLDDDYVKGFFKTVFTTFVTLMSAANAKAKEEAEIKESGETPAAEQEDGQLPGSTGNDDAAPHPFASVLSKVEAALTHAPFVGEGGVLSVADLRMACGVNYVLTFGQMLLWPKGRGGTFCIEESVAEVRKSFPLTAAWFGERLLPHLLVVSYTGQRLFLMQGTIIVKKLAFLNLQPPAEFIQDRERIFPSPVRAATPPLPPPPGKAAEPPEASGSARMPSKSSVSSSVRSQAGKPRAKRKASADFCA